MITDKWNDANLRAPFPRTTENLHGHSVYLQISPYDVPTAYRVICKCEEGIVRIEFRYPNSELSERLLGDEGVYYEVGAFSKKLLAIEVPVPPADCAAVAQALECRMPIVLERANRLVGTLRHETPQVNARLNYEAADQILRNSIFNQNPLPNTRLPSIR